MVAVLCCYVATFNFFQTNFFVLPYTRASFRRIKKNFFSALEMFPPCTRSCALAGTLSRRWNAKKIRNTEFFELPWFLSVSKEQVIEGHEAGQPIM